MKVVCVVQARMASSRLPGKVMLKLAGEPVLSHVLSRARRISGVDQVLVATTRNPEDDLISDWASAEKVEVFRGSEDNVVERLLLAADFFGGTHLARVTADCPLIDPAVCDAVITACLEEDADFGSNYLPPTYPDGLDFSLTKVDVLKSLSESGLNKHDREHVTTVFEKNPERFRTINVSSDVDLSGQRWTLDNYEDLIFLRALLEKVRDADLGTDYGTILRTLRENPEIASLQSNMMRNYGHIGKNAPHNSE